MSIIEVNGVVEVSNKQIFEKQYFIVRLHCKLTVNECKIMYIVYVHMYIVIHKIMDKI